MGEYFKNRNSPPHYFLPESIYMVTACTYQKRPFLWGDRRKWFFLETLFELLQDLGWNPDAWAVHDNHYHLIVRSNEKEYRITRLVRPLHSITAKFVNKIDGASGRRIWQNYWDTLISFERSYLARMKYVLFNPVKHGLVEHPEEYAFSSYRWFMREAEQECIQSIMAIPIDKVCVRDDF
jgi:putative transposase